MIDEWIKKLWHTYTREYYAAIRKNMQLLEKLNLVICCNLEMEDIMCSEITKKEDNNGLFISLWYMEQENKQ